MRCTGQRKANTDDPIIHLVIPGPPMPVNRLWRRSGNVTYKSREAKAYADRVRWEAKAAGCPMMPGPLAVEIVYFHQHEKRRYDVDSPIKCLLDSLEGVLYRDDKQIRSVSCRVERDRANPRVEVTVRGAGEEPE